MTLIGEGRTVTILASMPLLLPNLSGKEGPEDGAAISLLGGRILMVNVSRHKRAAPLPERNNGLKPAYY